MEKLKAYRFGLWLGGTILGWIIVGCIKVGIGGTFMLVSIFMLFSLVGFIIYTFAAEKKGEDTKTRPQYHRDQDGN